MTFMADSLLGALITGKTQEVVRTPSQDLESLLWVLLYVVYRNAVDEYKSGNTKLKAKIAKDFDALFSGPSVENLRDQRRTYIKNDDIHDALLEYAWSRSQPKKNFSALIACTVRLLRDITWVPRRVHKYENPHHPTKNERRPPLEYDTVFSVLGRFWNTEYV